MVVVGSRGSIILLIWILLLIGGCIVVDLISILIIDGLYIIFQLFTKCG